MVGAVVMNPAADATGTAGRQVVEGSADFVSEREGTAMREEEGTGIIRLGSNDQKPSSDNALFSVN